MTQTQGWADMCAYLFMSVRGGCGWMVSTLQWPLDLRATDPAMPLFLPICPQLCVTLKHRAQVSEQTSISLQSHWKVCNATAAISATASCIQKKTTVPSTQASSLFFLVNCIWLIFSIWLTYQIKCKQMLKLQNSFNQWCLFSGNSLRNNTFIA